MANRPFRFVHASDLHLELPPQGLLEIPDHLHDTLRDAAYLAAEKIFDLVLSTEADFLILSGDVLKAEWTGLRGPLFLLEQFERLAERDVLVYWAGGKVDPPEAWPQGMRLPDNVHVFPRGRPSEVTVWRDDCAVASIVGCSRAARRGIRAADFICHKGELFSMAVIHGKAAADKLLPYPVHYWALGGEHRRNTLFNKPHLAQCPGTPQGRTAEDDGAHGCWVVQVDAGGQPQPAFEATDVIRWFNPRIGVEENATRDDLEKSLRERVKTLREEAKGTGLLVNWIITGDGPLARELRRGGLAQELTQWLRAEFGQESPAVWTNSILAEPPARFPAARYEEATILGDFLRQVRTCQEDLTVPVNLRSLLKGRHSGERAAAALTKQTPADRQRLLREVAALGADLLSGEEQPE